MLSIPAYMFGVLSVTITIRFELKRKSCNSVWQFYFGLKEGEKHSLKSYVVQLALQFSDNVRTFFSKCNTKRPVDLFTNTVTKETKLVLEAVTWCLEGTQQVSVFSQACIFFTVFEKDSEGNLCVYLGTACFLENRSYGTLRTESPSTHLAKLFLKNLF